MSGSSLSLSFCIISYLQYTYICHVIRFPVLSRFPVIYAVPTAIVPPRCLPPLPFPLTTSGLHTTPPLDSPGPPLLFKSHPAPVICPTLLPNEPLTKPRPNQTAPHIHLRFLPLSLSFHSLPPLPHVVGQLLLVPIHHSPSFPPLSLFLSSFPICYHLAPDCISILVGLGTTRAGSSPFNKEASPQSGRYAFCFSSSLLMSSRDQRSSCTKALKLLRPRAPGWGLDSRRRGERRITWKGKRGLSREPWDGRGSQERTTAG